MQPRRRLIGSLLAAVAGIAILGVAFVPAWLVHDRVLLGEGPRHAHVLLSVWQGLAVPLLVIAVVGVALSGALALLARRFAGASAGPWVALPAGIGLAILLGAVPSISQQGHASGVTVSAGWALGIGIGLAAVALAGTWLASPPSRRVLTVGVGAAVLVAAGTWGGRQLQLDLVEGNGQHFSEGSYTRAAGNGQPSETMTLQGGRFSVAERWSGAYEPSGRVVSLTGDPACPTARGSYHVDAAPDGGIKWETIVDTCANGARAADLTTGIWQRDH